MSAVLANRDAAPAAAGGSRLIYLMGASGSGKDTLLRHLRTALRPDEPVLVAHRYITRPSGADEASVSLSDTEFQRRAGFTAGMDSAALSVSAAKVALAGYRGLMRGKRIVLPGLGIRAIPFLLRFVPRGFVLMMVGLIQRNR